MVATNSAIMRASSLSFFAIIAHPETLALRQQHYVQPVARNVDTTVRKVRHLRIPSLPMRARALATVRVWKRRLEHQAHSRFEPRRRRASSHDGDRIVTRPPSPISMLLSRHTRRREFMAALLPAAATSHAGAQ